MNNLMGRLKQLERPPGERPQEYYQGWRGPRMGLFAIGSGIALNLVKTGDAGMDTALGFLGGILIAGGVITPVIGEVIHEARASCLASKSR